MLALPVLLAALLSFFLFATLDAARATSKYVPLKALPHPGELFFNIDAMRAKPSQVPASCSFPINIRRPPHEAPAVRVGWKPGGGEAPDGNWFAIALMGATSYLTRATPEPGGPQAQAVAAARTRLLEWARADAMREFDQNNGSHWWAVYQAFPAILLTYNALKHDGMLSEAEQKDIRAWMEKLLKRARIGVELDFHGPYRPNDERINNQNGRRNLVSLLWAVESNNVGMFNRAVENGYMRFLKTMRADGSVPDANRGNWALVYTALNIGSAMFLAEAAAHQGVDLYSLEFEGRSIHSAVKWLLDANDDPAVAGRYAAANAGMKDKERQGVYAASQDTWWKRKTDYGVSASGWLELYVSRFPDTENTRRLLLLAAERQLHTGLYFFMDWGFGNVTCFWGKN